MLVTIAITAGITAFLVATPLFLIWKANWNKLRNEKAQLELDKEEQEKKVDRVQKQSDKWQRYSEKLERDKDQMGEYITWYERDIENLQNALASKQKEEYNERQMKNRYHRQIKMWKKATNEVLAPAMYKKVYAEYKSNIKPRPRNLTSKKK